MLCDGRQETPPVLFVPALRCDKTIWRHGRTLNVHVGHRVFTHTIKDGADQMLKWLRIRSGEESNS